MIKWLLRCLFVLLIGSTTVMAEDMKIEIIPMKHRLVSDVIPVIRPLVNEGGTVTGMNNQLIVKTTPSNLQQIKQVLEQIDYAPRNLMISVKQNVAGNFRSNEQSVSGRIDTGDVDINIPDRQQGTIVEGKDSEGNIIRFQLNDSRSSNDDKNTYRVQTLEGHPAYINVGQSVPLSNSTTYITSGGVVVQDNVEYHDVGSGFYVLPRLQGNNVTLSVSPYMERISSTHPNAFNIQNMETVASGKLGEWIELGGVNQSSSGNDKRILGNRDRSGQENRTVLIKVEEVK